MSEELNAYMKLQEELHRWMADVNRLSLERTISQRDFAVMDRDALRARVAELERELARWPALECPCCGKNAARATFFEDGQETTCGCGGRVYADGDAFIRLDKCESKECAEGSDALAPRAEVKP